LLEGYSSRSRNQNDSHQESSQVCRCFFLTDGLADRLGNPERSPAGLWKAFAFPQPMENAPRFPQSDAHDDYEDSFRLGLDFS